MHLKSNQKTFEILRFSFSQTQTGSYKSVICILSSGDMQSLSSAFKGLSVQTLDRSRHKTQSKRPMRKTT